MQSCWSVPKMVSGVCWKMQDAAPRWIDIYGKNPGRVSLPYKRLKSAVQKNRPKPPGMRRGLAETRHCMQHE